MTTPQPMIDRELEDYVDAFESACERHPHEPIDVAEFFPARGHARYQEVVVELLRVAIEHRWRAGERNLLELCRRRFPDVLADTGRLADVAFEEYRLRRAAGESVTPCEYESRYGIRCDGWPLWEAAQPDDGEPRQSELDQLVPRAGQRFLDFDLVCELGRGAFARVFLARQGDLAHRLVALKISVGATAEPQRLARLQHTHIVPIFSVHRSGPLQAVCMPYLGGVTLADVWAQLQGRVTLPATGQEVITTLTQRQLETARGSEEAPDSGDAPARSFAAPPSEGRTSIPLAGWSYVKSIVWIGARIAEGLAHAHDHGVLHRDLKPANILLADDGIPLILDFNMAADLTVEDGARAMAGGTLPYMAPEQLAACRQSRPVDARSDVYALGVILYELLSGRRPYPLRAGPLNEALTEMEEDRRHPPARLSTLNPAVPLGLERLVDSCLERDVEHRCQTARMLQTDLERHFHDLPLRYVAGEPYRERIAKWVRRHPRLSSATAVATLAMGLILAIGAAWSYRGRELSRVAAIQAWTSFQEQLPETKAALTAPGLDNQSREQSLVASRALLAPFAVVDVDDWSLHAPAANLDRQIQGKLFESVAALLYWMADCNTRDAGTVSSEERTRRLAAARDWNARARALAPDSQALAEQSLSLAAISGTANADPKLHDPRPVDQVVDGARLDASLAAARALVGRRYAEAAGSLRKLAIEQPRDFATWFWLGNSCAGQAQWQDAETCFSVCTTIRPDAYLSYFHRGLVRLEQKRYEAARDDFDTVVRLRPDVSSAWANRGLAWQALGDLARAEQDFSEGLARGARETRLFFLRGRCRAARGDQQGAAADYQEGLRRRPEDELSWIERGVARVNSDPAGALADFEEALAIHPQSRMALQNSAHVLAERLGRREEALKVLEQLGDVSPNDPTVHSSRAVLLARGGQSEATLPLVNRVVQSSDDPLALYQAACALALLAARDRTNASPAVHCLRRALARQPELVRLTTTDRDLNAIRDARGFHEVVNAAAELLADGESTAVLRRTEN